MSATLPSSLRFMATPYARGVAPNENRLAAETSPYLRQHRHDPVDWYPWGEEAFARAKAMDRPLFLSIGYSACHWCHVMAHESFSDAITAAEMNARFVAVKIDREERPDVDAVYMEAVQAATGHGGWPMSIFATPDGRPFFAGTYFPNRAGHGAPTFRTVLAAVADAWENKRDELDRQAEALKEAVSSRLAPPRSDEDATLGPEAARAAVATACQRLGEIFDPVHGGFGRAPKFPQPLLLDLLLRAHVEGIGADLDPAPLAVVERTLEAMASGGIWDHLGGGFSRYSVDREWLVPHFEKMLYDQALLGRVYLHAWQVTEDPRWLAILKDIVEYVLRDLGLSSGGLASAEDADSEGAEGLFYTWADGDIEAVLEPTSPEAATAALKWWGVEPGGNFEGRSILFRPPGGDLLRPAAISEARARLFEARARRIRPGLDDKVLAEWNAMMCATLAEAALATGNTAWKFAAEGIGELLLERLRRPGDGRLLRSLPNETSERRPILGYSLDYAWVVEACVRLFECTGRPKWLAAGSEVAGGLLDLFEDRAHGGLFTTGEDAEKLVVRPREIYDNVTPSAGSVAAGALARLGTLVGRADLVEAARRLVAAGSAAISRAPTAVPELLGAAQLLADGTVDVVITGDRRDLVAEAGRRFLPRVVLCWIDRDAITPGEDVPELLAGREDGFAYVCRFGACRLPVSGTDELGMELTRALSAT
jgi:uncharacterized protein YyaL (SSP411 family)